MSKLQKIKLVNLFVGHAVHTFEMAKEDMSWNFG